MKLLHKISAAAASVALGTALFAGCTNIHDDLPVAIAPTGIIGTPTAITHTDSAVDIGWGDAWVEPFTYTDNIGTFTFKYVEPKWGEGAGNCALKLVDLDGKTLTAAYGANALVGLDDTANGFTWDMTGDNAVVSGLTANASYTITITPAEKPILSIAKASGSSSSETETLVPYYLDGYFILGPEEIGGNSDWAASLDTLLTNPTKDSETGYLTYKYVFTSSSTEVQFGIGTKGWATKYTGATFAVGETTDFVECTKGSDANNSITGMTVGTEYRILVQTTPEEKISFKVEENVEETHLMTLKFEVTNLSEGVEAWINGEFWSGWATGWPIAAWGAFGSGFEATDVAVADETGVASFGEKFDVGIDEAVGTALSYKFKAIASSDGWTNADKLNPASDLTCDITVAEGTYIVSVNATTEAVTVRKAE